MAGEIDLANGIGVEDTTKSMTDIVENEPFGISPVRDNRHLMGRSPNTAALESLPEEEVTCQASVENYSSTGHDDNLNLARDTSEKDLERCNNNPDNEVYTEEMPKESLKRSLSQPQINTFLTQNGDLSSASKKLKLDVHNDTGVLRSSNEELPTMKESKKESEVCDTKVGVEEGGIPEEDIVKERKANAEGETDEDEIRRKDNDSKKCEVVKEIEETKEDENAQQEYEIRDESRDAKEESCGKEENSKEDNDGQTEENEQQKEEYEGQKEEDQGQTEENDGERKENEQQKEEDKGQRDEEDIGDIRQKEDNNEKKSNKKSIDNQGLPAGWSRLSVPRKNGTHVDYYLVNQQGKKFRSQKEVDRWLQDQRQDLKVSLKPFSKQGQDIRRMFNDPKRTASRGEDISPHQDLPKSQKDCKIEKPDDDETRVPTSPPKKKRGRPKKTDSSASKNTAKLKETTQYDEQLIKTPAELGTGRPRRGCRESKPVIEGEDEEQVNSEAGEQGISPVPLKEGATIVVEQPQKENIDPTIETKLVKKAKKTKKEAGPEELDAVEDDVSEGSEDMDVVNESYLEEIAKFMEATDLGLIPDPPTKGDGNCWYRAAAEQVIVHSIPRVPKEHLKLRKAISDHLKNLPKQVKEDTINVVFVGKPRGLSDLAHRQRKPGQWVDNMGVMVMATAHFLRRNIHLIGYDPPGHPTERGYSLTVIEGEGGENYAPLTIFYHDSHYQTLRPIKPTRLPAAGDAS